MADTSNTSTYRVTMRLTQDDVETTEALEKALNARSKADAISQAMSIARMIVEAMQRGDEVLLRRPGSDVAERIVLPRLRVTPTTRVA